MVRFVASADWQLGMAAAFLDEEARPRFGRARFDVLERIGEVAAERAAEFLVVAGDVFESNQLDRKVLSRAFEVLNRITVPVYLLPGNHDPLDASSIYTSAEFQRRCPAHVRVLTAPGAHRIDGPRAVELVAAPWFSKRPLTDLVADATADLEPATETVRVVVGHGQVDSLNPDRHDPATIDESALRGALQDGRAQFAVLGDRHATYRVDDRIWYPGTPEVTSRREDDPGNVLVVDVDSDTVDVERVHVGAWEFIEHTAELTGDSDLVALEAELGGRSAKERTAVWLRLRGSLSVQQKAMLDDIWERAAELYAKLEIASGNDLVVVPENADFGELDLIGPSRTAVEELIALARSDSADAAAARDALGLLYRLGSPR